MVMFKREPDDFEEEGADVVGSDAELRRIASTGLWEVTKSMGDNVHSNTGTSAEVGAIDRHLREMISEGRYTYTFIEEYLMAKGYRQNLIRRVFKDLTGAYPDAFDTSKWTFMNKVPGIIPGMNCGWGEAKGKDYKYLFVMPWIHGFAGFGQKDAQTRVLVREFPNQELALAWLAKNVKETETPDHLLTKKDIKTKTAPAKKLAALQPQEQAIADYMSLFSNNTPAEHKSSYLTGAYVDGQLSKTAYLALHVHFCRTAAPVDGVDESTSESVDALVKELDATPVKSELAAGSSEAVFSTYLSESIPQDLDVAVKSVTNYLANKANDLSPRFKMKLMILRYASADPIKGLKENIEVPGEALQEPLRTSGAIAAVVRFYDSAAGNNQSKDGIMTFAIKHGELESAGNFKGSDDKLYSLSEEGVTKFFDSGKAQGH